MPHSGIMFCALQTAPLVVDHCTRVTSSTRINCRLYFSSTSIQNGDGGKMSMYMCTCICRRRQRGLVPPSTDTLPYILALSLAAGGHRPPGLLLRCQSSSLSSRSNCSSSTFIKFICGSLVVGIKPTGYQIFPCETKLAHRSSNRALTKLHLPEDIPDKSTIRTPTPASLTISRLRT